MLGSYLVALGLLAVASASASPITYQFSAVGSGTLYGVPFTNSLFTLTAPRTQHWFTSKLFSVIPAFTKRVWLPSTRLRRRYKAWVLLFWRRLLSNQWFLLIPFLALEFNYFLTIISIRATPRRFSF